MSDTPQSESTSEDENEIDWDQVRLEPVSTSLEDLNEQIDRSIIPTHRHRDSILFVYNDLARQGLSVGVTIYVRGIVISGTLCSGADFARNLAKTVENSPPDSIGAEMEEAFLEVAEMLAAPPQNPGHLGSLNFIHLRDARSFIPGHRGMPTNGSMMRFKIDEVDGWSLGKFSEDD